MINQGSGIRAVDVPAVAPLLGALLPMLEQLPGRPAALRWHDNWEPRLAPLGRCPRMAKMVASPECRSYRPCPLDSWYDHLAVAARGKVTDQSRKSFLQVPALTAQPATTSRRIPSPATLTSPVAASLASPPRTPHSSRGRAHRGGVAATAGRTRLINYMAFDTQ